MEPILLADEMFGAAQTSQWHRSRGIKRMLRSDPRWFWFNYYGTFGGFATDDPEIEQRFLACCAKANAVH